MRKTALVAALATVGMIANAQAPTTVAPSKSIDATLSAMEKDLVGLVEAMPADKFSFAPSADMFKGVTPNFKGVRTFAQEVQHITQAAFAIAAFTRGAKIDPALTAKMAEIGKMNDKADLVKALKEAMAEAHAAVATLTPENAWQQTGRGPLNTRAEQAVYIVAHSRDHYGQLVEYARMNGVTPPASEGRPPANPAKTN